MGVALSLEAVEFGIHAAIGHFLATRKTDIDQHLRHLIILLFRLTIDLTADDAKKL